MQDKVVYFDSPKLEENTAAKKEICKMYLSNLNNREELQELYLQALFDLMLSMRVNDLEYKICDSEKYERMYTKLDCLEILLYIKKIRVQKGRQESAHCLIYGNV